MNDWGLSVDMPFQGPFSEGPHWYQWYSTKDFIYPTEIDVIWFEEDAKSESIY
jgi:hypothetical protein